MIHRSMAGIAAIAVLFSGLARAEDWPQYRGVGGSASSKSAGTPLEWGDGKNLSWKTDLPGPGSSSPIVVGERVFVTCYTGYGTPGATDDASKLKRHLICLSRATGRIDWSAAVDAVLPEDRFGGFITEHGYASSTPASDGENVYVFFGKSGVVAFDLTGKRLWQTSVGTESDKRGWGSGSSLVLYKNSVIVNASSESQSIRALDKKTGKEIWKAEAASLSLSFSSPTLVSAADGHAELVVAVPGEIWGLNPDNGKLVWYASVRLTGNVCPSVVAGDGVAYVTGGFESRGTVAVRIGGKNDVTSSHVLWAVNESSYVPSPLLLDGRLYWIDEKGIAVCLDATTGKLLGQQRLQLNGRGGNGRPVYASLVTVAGRFLAVTRKAGAIFLEADAHFKQLAQNTLTDESDFNATPAIADGHIFLRSNRALYCIGSK